MGRQEEILIIGGGVIGVCAAYYLTTQGCQVTLVERDELCAGSSYGNAGLLVPSHSIPLAAPGVLSQGLKWLFDAESPFYVKPRLDPQLVRWLWKFRAACNEAAMRRGIPVLWALGQASMKLFEELAAGDDLAFGFQQRGWLLLFKDRRAWEEGIEEAHLVQEFGVASQALDAAGVRDLEPNVLPSVVGGVYYPGDAHLVPDRFVLELARIAEMHGACIKTHTDVLGFETSGRRVSAVLTTRGTLKPDQVVLAAGAWCPAVVRDLPLDLPIQAAKGYSLTVKCPPTSPTVPLYLTEGKVAVTPMGEFLRFAGTLELTGLDLSVSRRRVDAISRAVHEYLPGMSALEPIEIWRGLRSVTPDGLPLIGRSSALPNLIVASGHGMLGVSLGPVTGKLVSEIILHQLPTVDLVPLRVDRFS